MAINISIATKTRNEWGGLKAAHEEDSRRILRRVHSFAGGALSHTKSGGTLRQGRFVRGHTAMDPCRI